MVPRSRGLTRARDLTGRASHLCPRGHGVFPEDWEGDGPGRPAGDPGLEPRASIHKVSELWEGRAGRPALLCWGHFCPLGPRQCVGILLFTACREEVGRLAGPTTEFSGPKHRGAEAGSPEGGRPI